MKFLLFVCRHHILRPRVKIIFHINIKFKNEKTKKQEKNSKKKEREQIERTNKS